MHKKAIIFPIQPILDSRAEFCLIFRLFFGQWSFEKKCFWDLLTFKLEWSKLSVPSITKDVLDKSKRAADTSVNAYLSIYFAYTPFYGSLTLYEWVPLSKSVQLHSLHCTEAKLYKRTKSRPSRPAHEFIEFEQHHFGYKTFAFS